MPALTARQVTVPTTFTLAAGQKVAAFPGDWIIANGTLAIEICPAEQFDTRFETIDAGLVLPNDVCTQLEEIVGVGTTRYTPHQFLRAVERLAHIVIGDIRIDFSPGQLEEIAFRAAKRGYTVEQEISRIVDRIKDEIFYKS